MTAVPTSLLIRDDLIPPIKEQAAQAGWKAGIYSFGKAEMEKVDYFNPSLVERPDGTWLIVRRSVFEDRLRFGRNDIMAFKLEENRPLYGRKVKIPFMQEGEQFEDPRAVYWQEKTWIGACNFVWHGKTWTGAHQILAECDDSWIAQVRHDPIYGKNGGGIGQNHGHEKNWVWFVHKNKMHMIYQGPPEQVILKFDTMSRPTDIIPGPREDVPWGHGIIRGGTPPVLVNGEYWTFFHSSTEWKPPYRRYFMGAYAFENKPPFRVTKITPQALLIGNQHDYWQPRKPLVVFPCGALLRGDKWLVTLGVNDLKCGFVEIPHEDLEIVAEEI
jgi:predicted GH43/DUF377 family glycosyl hydrolase